MIFLGVGAVLFDSYRTTHKVAAQTPQIQQAAKEDRETAAGTPPGAPSAAAAPATSGGSAAAYQVPADQPKYIEIPKIRVKARVSPLGLDKTGAVAVPASTSRVGWYSNSARPSAPGGAALMVGHVSGYTRAGGVFINLKKLEAGDKITVTMGDDTTYTYTVATKKLQSKDTVDMTEALTPVRLDKKGLNLMTCAGKYDAKSETYDERLIVFAALE